MRMNVVDRAKAIWNLFTTGGLTKADKWILVLALLYCLSPIDIVPDIVPVLGFMDDLLVAVMAMRHFCKRSAQMEPKAVPVTVKVS